MLGYHDCPPHLFESLDPVYDAKWLRQYGVRGLKDALDELSSYQESQLLGGVRISVLHRRYK